ncbi:MAG: hypothetical protein IJR83_01150 [Clostridia bacterium]|nr:hypothetical protein [Clostridia bacterium]
MRQSKASKKLNIPAFSRSASLVLAIVMALLSLSALSAFAADAVPSPDGLFATTLSASSAQLQNAEEGIVLHFTKADPSLTAQMREKTSGTYCNALRIVLQNESACASMTVKISTAAGLTEEATVQLETYSAARDYYAYFGRLDEAVTYTVTFKGVSEGSARFYAVSPVSVIRPDADSVNGTIGSCLYNQDTGTVTISGTVKSGVLASNRTARLELFMIPRDADVNEYLASNPSPVSVQAIANHFSFQTPQLSTEELLCRFAVCIRATSGERTLLTNARYVSFKESGSAGQKDLSAFKGLETTQQRRTALTNPEAVYVDVWLNRLTDAAETDYAFSAMQTVSYFSRDYVSKLDEEIRRYAEAGAAVYLRLLVSPGTDEEYASSAEYEGAEYAALRADSVEAVSSLYACVSYLCARYKGMNLSGLVIGRSADLSLIKNCAGVIPLQTYVSGYVKVINTVAWAAGTAADGLQIIVPVSDSLPKSQSVTDEELDGLYRTDLFLESLSSELGARCGDSVSVCLMLENTHVSYQIDASHMLRVFTDSEYSHPNNLSPLRTMLQKTGGSIQKNFIYCYEPDASLPAEVQETAYTYSYYKLFYVNDVLGHVLSLSHNETEGTQGQLDTFEHVLSVIDTARTEEAGDKLLKLMQLKLIQSVTSNFDEKNLANRYAEYVALAKDDFSETGKYAYWNFSTATGNMGWSAQGMSNMRLLFTQAYGRVLCATLPFSSSDRLDYIGMDYWFTEPLNVSSVDGIVLDMAIDSDNAASVYEVLVQTGNDQVLLNGNCIIDGTLCYLRLDLSDLDNYDMQFLRVYIRRLDGLRADAVVYIRNIYLVSDTVSSEQLQVSAQATRDGNTGFEGMTMPMRVALLAVLAVTVLAVVLAFRIYFRSRSAARR